MATIGRLVVQIGADAGPLQQGIKSAQTSLRNFGANLRGMGTGLSLGVTLPLVGIATAAVAAGTALDERMGNVQSLGLSIDRVNELKASVQALAIATGTDTSTMADGLYQVISAFGDSADTVKILEINARAAAAGLATTEEAIALTSAVTKGYGDTSAEAVTKASDLAFVAVKLGQTTFPELAGAMGRVVPLAAGLAVSQEELFAVMATATGVTGGAAEVSTQLRGVLQALMAPTSSMTGLMETYGYASGEAMLESLGLQGTIGAIVAAAETSGTPLQKYIGSIEGQTLAMALAGPLADDYTGKLGAMQEAAGATDAAFQAQTQGINSTGFAIEQAKARFQVFMQQLAAGLAPVLTQVLELLAPMADRALELANRFANLDPKTQTLIVGIAAVAAAAGPVLVALGTMATVLAGLLSPVGAVIAVVAALGAAWATNFGGIREKTAAMWAVVQPLLQGAWEWFQAKLPAALATLQGVWEGVTTALTAAWQALSDFFAPAIETLRAAFETLGLQFSLLKGPAATLIESLLTSFGNLWTALEPILRGIGGMLLVIVDFGINLLASAVENLALIMTPIFEAIGATVEAVSGIVTSMVEAVTLALQGDFAGAWEAAQGILTSFSQGVIDILTALKDFVVAIGITISEAVLGTLEDLGIDAAALLEGIKGWWEEKWQSLADFVQPVIDVVQNVIEKLTEAWQWLQDHVFTNPFQGWDLNPFNNAPVANGAGRNARGTAWWPGGLSWVGEEGPELVRLPRGSAVYSAPQSANMAGATIHVTVNQALDWEEVRWRLQDLARRRG
jgi:TP901 family phage tail tape measure protein